MKAKISMDDESEFSEDCGEVSTYSREVGTAGNREHGIFSNLGNGSYIINENYTGKYCDIMLQISTGETVLKTFKVRSDTSSYNVKL